MIRFPCPRCGAALKAPDERAGKQVTCPDCERAVPVPEPDDAPAAELDDDPPARRFRVWAWAGGGGAVLAVVLVVALVARSRSGPPDAEAIVGQWELLSGTVSEDGVRNVYPSARGPRGPIYFHIDRGGHLQTNKDSASFVLDPARAPKWISVTFDDAGLKDRFVEC